MLLINRVKAAAKAWKEFATPFAEAAETSTEQMPASEEETPASHEERPEYATETPVYTDFSYDLHLKLLIESISCILKARTGKSRLNAAVVGYHPLVVNPSEMIADTGFDISFFEGKPDDLFHPSRDLAAFDASEFDIVFLADLDAARERNLADHMVRQPIPVVRLISLLQAHAATLKELSKASFSTCLNCNKLGLVSAALALCPSDRDIFEIGIDMAGTTNYMALQQKMLGNSRHIYALDTFTGMPEPSAKDFGEGFVYTSDLFKANTMETVKWRISQAGTEALITIVPGLCQDTLPGLIDKQKPLGFVLLDTDQYSGTHAGLECLAPLLDKAGMIIVDDTTVKGVDEAIREALAKDAGLVRRPLVTNFDAILRVN